MAQLPPAPPARVIVCGSRTWRDRKLIADTLNDLVEEFGWRYPDPVIVHGACPRGADKLCDDEAGKAGLLVERHPADWDRYGKRAGFVRNEEMAAAGAVLCVGFWDGRSAGTWDMLNRAEQHEIPTRTVTVQLGTTTPEASPKSSTSNRGRSPA